MTENQVVAFLSEILGYAQAGDDEAASGAERRLYLEILSEAAKGTDVKELAKMAMKTTRMSFRRWS